MNLKKVIRGVCPPLVWNLARKLNSSSARKSTQDRITFLGDWGSWEEAVRASEGYAAPEILAKTREALLKVKNGEAAYERDSVLFDTIQYEFPLLAGLLRAATASGSRLSVLDFGGALGSTYFQCRNFLSVARELRWSVVEQPMHVACGQAEFANDQLRFYTSIEECLRYENPNVLLLSSVIQYLSNPYDFLTGALRHGFDFVVVDRTAFMRDGRDRLTVQHVPTSIYKASYPAWFLSERRLRECFRERYQLACEFAGSDTVQPEGGGALFKGFHFQLRPKLAPK